MTTAFGRAFSAGVVLVLLSLGAFGCAAALPTAPAAPLEANDWVVVTFAGTDDEFDLDVMDALLETEGEADEALQSSGAGWIDGNDIGDHEYNLYFNGYDRTVMWGILEPIFADAPVSWSRVELRGGLDTDEPTVITP